MQLKPALLFLGVLSIAVAQAPSKAVIVNLESAKWDSDGVMLHAD